MTARSQLAATVLAWILIFPAFAGDSPPGQRETRPVAAGVVPRIVSPAPEFRFPDGQRLVYSVVWHMLNAGTTTILTQPSTAGEQVSSTADSSGLANRIYPVHDRFEAVVDPRTFCTQQISKHNQEGSRRLERTIRFLYPQAKSTVDDSDFKGKPLKHAEFDIPACVTDIVSGFFYVASLPLKTGFSEVFPVNDGGRTTEVRIEVESAEKVRVPAGEFHTLRVMAEPILGPMQGKGKLWVWLTDDTGRLPVEIKSKLGFATLVFHLERIERVEGKK